jgi:hypothetical protein
MAEHVRCSFCGKLNTQVRSMAASPFAAICNECIEVAVRVTSDHGSDLTGFRNVSFLSVEDRFYLVKIAYETQEPEVRRWVLDTLQRDDAPPLRLDGCGAGMVQEIEVTKEMLEAGMAEFMCHEIVNGDTTTWGPALTAAFLAMDRVRRSIAVQTPVLNASRSET